MIAAGFEDAALPPGSTEARRAALFVGGLAEADRRWLVGALDQGEQRVLEPLLRELAALDLVAASPRGANAQRNDRVSAMPSSTPTRIAQDLASWPPRAIAARLEAEPDDVVLLVLRQADSASVRHRALSAVETGRRHRLATQLCDEGPGTTDTARGRALEAAWLALPQPADPGWPMQSGLDRAIEALRARWPWPPAEPQRVRAAAARAWRPLGHIDVAGGWRAWRRRVARRHGNRS